LSKPDSEPVVPFNIGQFNEKLGWSLKPDSYGTSMRTGYKIEYRINSKGLRDDETEYKKPPGKFRIILIGDSSTFGFGVPIEKHFSTSLEGYFKDVEIINMGVSGFGIDQELIFLQIEGFRYQPDLVMAYVPHFKDHRHMHTIRWGKRKPRFLLTDGKLVLTNSPLSTEESSIFRRIHRWFSRYSKVYEILRNGIVGLVKQGSSNSPREQREQDNKNARDEFFRKELFELGEAIIYSMHQESLKNGANFVLVSRFRKLFDVALKRGIISFDVTEPIDNSKFYSLRHINESGNGVLAWEIAKFLKKTQLIPDRHLK
jgi:hypothetical protein